MPRRSNLAIRKAHWLNHRGSRNEAARLLDRTIEKGSRDPRVGLLRATLLGSDESLRALADEYPDNPAIGLHFAVAQLKRGNLNQAGQIAERALVGNGDNITLKILLAIIKVKETQVWDHLISQIKNLPMASAAIRAIALMEIEKAIAIGDKSDNGAKEPEEGMGGIAGSIFLGLDHLAVLVYWLLKQAINLIRNMANLKQMKIDRYQIEGERLEGVGQPEAGAKYREKVLALDPENKEALQSILLYHLEIDDFINTQKYLDELKKVDPDDFEKNSYIKAVEAETLFAQKRYPEALNKYSRILGDFPYNHILPYKKGLAYLRMGDEASAATWFETALKLPNENLIKERLEKLAGLLAQGL